MSRRSVSSSRYSLLTIRSSGAIAQLGERVLCKHEVVGSIPSGSTRWSIGRNERRTTRPESFARHARSSRHTPVGRLVARAVCHREEETYPIASKRISILEESERPAWVSLDRKTLGYV